MYNELFRYLLQHKQLNLPGIGTFLLERTPARGDFANKQILPPSNVVVRQPTANPGSMRLFAWLAEAMNISDREAVVLFNDFAFDLKKKISNGDIIHWNGIGTFSKGAGGEIKFTPLTNEHNPDEPVVAEKVIREMAEHRVRVGENERTSAEMLEMLGKHDKKRSNWWAPALILGLLAILFIGWYFSEYGLDPSSAANMQKLRSQDVSAPYKILP